MTHRHDPATTIECDRCTITVCAACIFEKYKDEIECELDNCPIPSDACPMTIVYQARKAMARMAARQAE